jgi:hypothetical protein
MWEPNLQGRRGSFRQEPNFGGRQSSIYGAEPRGSAGSLTLQPNLVTKVGGGVDLGLTCMGHTARESGVGLTVASGPIPNNN